MNGAAPEVEPEEPPGRRHAREFSERSFRRKLLGSARRAGRGVVEQAVVLYFCFRDPDTPAWAKATILGALGYFMNPLDAIPDWTVGLGFTDDLGVLALAAFTVALRIKPEHRRRAGESARSLLG